MRVDEGVDAACLTLFSCPSPSPLPPYPLPLLAPIKSLPAQTSPVSITTKSLPSGPNTVQIEGNTRASDDVLWGHAVQRAFGVGHVV